MTERGELWSTVVGQVCGGNFNFPGQGRRSLPRAVRSISKSGFLEIRDGFNVPAYVGSWPEADLTKVGLECIIGWWKVSNPHPL